MQRQTDENFASEVATRARCVILATAKRVAVARAVSAVDMAVGFGICLAVQRHGSFCGRCAPAGMTLFAFYDFAASSNLNNLARLPLLSRLPTWLLIAYLGIGTAAADLAPVRLLPKEVLIATSSVCSPGQLAVWQFLSCCSPATLGRMLRQMLVLALALQPDRLNIPAPTTALEEQRQHTLQASRRRRTLELWLTFRRTVVRGLLSAAAVQVFVTQTNTEGGRIVVVARRWLPSCLTERGDGYVLSCIAPMLLLYGVGYSERHAEKKA